VQRGVREAAKGAKQGAGRAGALPGGREAAA
jgi:hypothetical protein